MSLGLLSDEDFLELYIEILRVNPPARSFAVSNLDYQILFANQTYLDFIGLPLERVVGKRVRDLDSFIAQYSPLIRPMVEKAHASDKYVRWILQIEKEERPVWLDCYFLRLKNPSNGHLVGMTSNINWAKISNPMLNVMNAINKKVLLVEDDSHSNRTIKLSGREHEIVALLTIGKSYKEVAWILGNLHGEEVNPATIATLTYRKIFPKFKAGSLSELIQNVLALGILDVIPASFI